MRSWFLGLLGVECVLIWVLGRCRSRSRSIRLSVPVISIKLCIIGFQGVLGRLILDNGCGCELILSLILSLSLSLSLLCVVVICRVVLLELLVESLGLDCCGICRWICGRRGWWGRI